MSSITLEISFDKNTSLQIGDIIYYLNSQNKIEKIGNVTAIGSGTITCNVTQNLSSLTYNSYIFFGKDNQINTSGVLGYYAQIDFTNNSKLEAELFAVNSEIFISSN